MTGDAPVVEVTAAVMGTIFAVQMGHDEATAIDALTARGADVLGIARAVEATCSRFDPDSELSRLCAQTGTPVTVSPLLFELLALAVAIADRSGGAFDPTVGARLAQRGVNRAWDTGRVVLPPPELPTTVSWRDVQLDRDAGTVTLRAPLQLDLGALAKGFAADLMMEALRDLPHASIHAGGDVCCHGVHPAHRAWRIGVRHPHRPDSMGAVAELAEGAVCTSGNYERAGEARAGRHLLDPRTDEPAAGLASVTVVAPTAVIADGLSTAAFVLGPHDAPAWLAQEGVDALLVSDAGVMTPLSITGRVRWLVT